MAELILSPIAQQIIGSLGSAAVREISSLWGVNDELNELEETMSTIKAVLLDAEEKQAHNHQVRNWLQRLGSAFHMADDLMDEFKTEALRRQLMSGNDMAKQVCTFFSASNQLAFRHNMVRRIREIKKKLEAISKDRNFLLESRHEEIQVVSRTVRETHSFVRQEEVIGRDEDRMAIVKLLLEGDVIEGVSIIPIVGMGGLGKTTLAQSVFNDEQVQKHFDQKIWLCVADDFDLKVIVKNIIKLSSTSNNVNLGDVELMDQLQREFRKALGGSKYLLVLDDVWNEDHEKWRQLKDLLVSTGLEGSRVVVTTRSMTVAQITGITQPYKLGILDEDRSWLLFKNMAFEEGEEPKNATILEVGRAIVRKCGGVPLAIRTIGSMLRFKNSDLEYWSLVDKEFSKISQQKEEKILQTLGLSYDRLASHLKHCFAYCALFPKDYKFEVQTLVKLWMAQGFLNLSNPTYQCLEDVGYAYFMELFERSFFQEVEIGKWDTIEKCKMHDLMHDLAIQVAGAECVVQELNEGCVNKNTLHVSKFKFESPEPIPTSLVQARRIRTILSPRLQGDNKVKTNKSILNAIINNFEFIRTLDSNDLGIKVVPNSISKLKHLRYLDLSDNGTIETLPNSITNLLNLQTLKLNRCYRLRELPENFEKLVNLRHLELKGCRSLTCMPNGLGQKTNLQTLSKYVLCKRSGSVPRHGGELKEIMELNNLTGELEISNLTHGKAESVSANLKEKQHLRSLKLHWDSDVDGTDTTEAILGYEMSLEGLQPHPNIESLALEYYGGIKFSSWLSSLTNLVELSLSSCNKCQHLPPQNQFHRLKKLELRSLPSLEYIWNSSGGEDFLSSLTSETKLLSSLRELWLENLPNLKGWWRDDTGEVESFFAVKTTSKQSTEENQRLLPSFTCLTELFIDGCPKLTCMPLYPYLEERLCLDNTSMKPFQQTIESCSALVPIPTTSSFSPLSKLTMLQIIQIEDLQCLPDSFKSLVSLKRLWIWNCSKLKDLRPGIQHLCSLVELWIENCEELEEMFLNDDEVMWKALNERLHILQLSRFYKLVALPQGIQHLTSLKQLRISDFDSLETIHEWISNLKSLKTLEVWDCPKLTSLPDGIRNLVSLKKLYISSCPILSKRCQRQIGEDWLKIAHIQELMLFPDPNKDNQNLSKQHKNFFDKIEACNMFKNFGLCSSGTSHT